MIDGGCLQVRARAHELSVELGTAKRWQRLRSTATRSEVVTGWEERQARAGEETVVVISGDVSESYGGGGFGGSHGVVVAEMKSSWARWDLRHGLAIEQWIQAWEWLGFG
ncbi:hypothetical protein M0R45_035806 [Rubus argutus]|uniref:Uncharacterized protein n=1 Tax=Rubus argutus TaxID=59490 RepID=A0AAW1VV92_RUBAR